MKNMISPATPRSLIITAISLAVFVSFRESHAQSVLNVDLDSGTATSKTGLAATGQTGTDFWNFYSRDDGQGGWRTLGGVANLKYANGVSSSVGLIVLNAPGSWGNGSSDPMFNGYLYPFSGNATLSVTNLPPGSYDFYIYGPDGSYQVTVSGTDYGTKGTTNAPVVNPVVWQEYVQYVVIRSVAVGSGQTATITVRPGVSGYATISGIQIAQAGTKVNHAPVANPQTVVLAYNGSRNITLTASDSDGDSLTYAVATAPGHGTLSGTAPNLSYQSASNYTGSDSFTFTANDGQVDSSAATVNITVLPNGTMQMVDVDFGSGTATTETGPAATGHTANDLWNFYTRDDGNGGWLTSGALSNLKTVESAPTTAGLTVLNAPGAWGNGSADAMYNSYIYPFNGGNVTVTVTNLSVGQYDLYIYGGDSSYQVSVGGVNYGPKPLPNVPAVNPVVWQEGQQYVLFRNIPVASSGQAMTLSVIPGGGGYATISGMQIASVTPTNHVPVANRQTVTVTQDGTKAVTLTGIDPDGDPLSYAISSQPAHGTLTGTAPNLSYAPSAGYFGSDSFTFTVNDGQVESTPATVSITVLQAGTKPLIDVDFGAGAATTETGPAATGHAANDFWNFYTRDGQGGWLSFGGLSNLQTVEGGTTAAGLTVENAPGAWGNGSADAMYDSYIYPFGGNAIITVTNLDPGAYDFYVYGLDSSYEITVAGLSYGTQSLPNGPYANPVVWQEGLQYVVFSAVEVTNGHSVVLIVRPGPGGYATISGLQIAQVEAPTPVAPSIVQQPASQSVGEGSDVTFHVAVAGTSPFSYEWRVGGTPIQGATTASLTLHHVTFNDAGRYSVRVSNPVDTVVSDDAVLTVTPVNHPPVANSQTVVIAQNTSVAITLTGTDSDSNVLSYIVVSSPAHGTLTGSAPNLLYQPTQDYSGSDSFTFKANDGQVDSAVATVSITILSDLSKALINVDFGAGTSTKTGPAATGQSTNDFWNFYSRDDGFGNWLSFGVLADLKFAEGTASAAGLTVANAPGAWGSGSADPMYDSYIYPFNGGNITVTVTNLPTGQYDVYVYGLDSAYQLSAGSADYGTRNLPNGPIGNPVVWQEGLQYVVFRNVQASSSQELTLTVLPGSGGYATISGMQLASVNPTNHVPVANSQNVTVSQDGTKAITLTGSDLDGDTLSYDVNDLPTHGTLTGTPPNLTYAPLAGYSGADSFTFSVNDGQIDSAPATVSITVLGQGMAQLIDIDFGSGTATTETGQAATGQSASDFWNFYTRDDGHGGWLSFGTLASLKFVDGTASGAGLTVANAAGAWGNGSADPMYNSYIYPLSGGNVTVTVTNLPRGQFDFYVYGIESGYRLTVGSADYGSKTVPNGPVVNPVVWQEGLQYVVFRSVSVTNGGQAVTVTVTPGASGYATISGMQISSSGTSSPPPNTNTPPVAKANLEQPFSLPGNTNLFVISGNGSNTVVVLDGSLSSDANNDPLTYSWLAGSLTPFAIGAMATNVWNLGVYDVVLVVSDGKATSTANLEFEVINTSGAIVELAFAVEQSSLDRTTKRQLEEVLLDNSGNSDAVNLQAFQDKVQSYVSPIDPALATALGTPALHILNSISSP